MSRKGTYFNRLWLNSPKYVTWLAEVKGSPTHAYCKLCERSFSLSNMGEAAVKSHLEGQRHKKYQERQPSASQPSLSAFCKLKTSATVTSLPLPPSEVMTPSSSMAESVDKGKDTGEISLQLTGEGQPEGSLQAAANPGMAELVVPAPPPAVEVQPHRVPGAAGILAYLPTKETREAEIRWVIKCVLSHYSYSANSDIGDLFRSLFPDSSIAQKFTCGSTKTSYLLCFGIAPYLRETLISSIRSSPSYVVCFDESLNKICHEEQMDVVVRYIQGHRVVSRYLCSQFLGHTRAADIVDAFKDATKELNPAKMLQVSMDGPATNYKMLELLMEDRNQLDPGMPKLLELGSCSLHIVHGAFATGASKTGWNIDRLLRSLFYLFDNAPARRQDFTDITKSSSFPKRFCSTRWVEDIPVAERALEIWLNIVKYVKETQKKKKSEIPSIHSYQVVADAVNNDPLVPAKLEVFISVARLLKPFLEKYQTDAPMLPFLAADLEQLLRHVLQRCVKQSVLAEASTGSKLVKLDLHNSLLLPKQVDVGFGARSNIASLGDAVRPALKLEFYNGCRQFFVAVADKILEKSPLKYSLVRGLVSLDPRFVVAHPHSSVTKFTAVLNYLSTRQWISHQHCDETLRQYRELASMMQDRHKVACEGFHEKTCRLDDFYFEVIGLHKLADLKAVCETMLMLLTLSHGQATVERGFSVNKDTLAPNMSKESLCAQRLVHSSLTAAGIKSATEFPVTAELLQSCRSASSRYHTHMDQLHTQKQQAADHKRKNQLELELDEAVSKKKCLEETRTKMLTEADKKAKQAEEKHDFVLLASSNALRQRANEMKNSEISDITNTISGLRKKLGT